MNTVEQGVNDSNISPTNNNLHPHHLLNIEENNNDANKLKCTVNTETNKTKVLKKSGSYADAVRGRMLTQSEIV